MIATAALTVASVSAAGLHFLTGREGRSGTGWGIAAGLCGRPAGGGLRPAGPGMQRGRGARREPVLRPEGVPAGLFLQLLSTPFVEAFWAPRVFTLQIVIKPSLSCPEEL